MDTLTTILRWFSGGDHQYMVLRGCMQHDWFWIGLTLTLDFAVAAGYVLIALHWWRNQKLLPDIPAKRALSNMRNIFIFCGICGYLFIPIKMVWPAWRLYDFAMAFLVYFTWSYALNTRHLKVIYSELGRTTQLAQDLEKSRDESQRKSTFLNAISHDLRTPLNGLMLQSELAEMCLKNNDAETLQQALVEIRANTKSTSHLLDSLLEYARMELSGDQLHLTEFKLSGVLSDLTSRCRVLAEQKKINLRIGECDGITVRTDQLRLERILTNLVDNAIKFTPAGAVRVEVERSAENLEIHVIDSGVGIDPAVQQKLFDEFFQVNNHERDRNKGFGMGLCIARRLARQLGGDISVDSAIGRGSRFSVRLPGVVGQNAVGFQTGIASGSPSPAAG